MNTFTAILVAIMVAIAGVAFPIAHQADVDRCIRHGGATLPFLGLCRDAAGNPVSY